MLYNFFNFDDDIDIIIDNVNRLNGLYYLYYYTKAKDKNKKLKIPQFFYFKLPKSGNTKFKRYNSF